MLREMEHGRRLTSAASVPRVLCSILIAVEELSYRPTLMCKLLQSTAAVAPGRKEPIIVYRSCWHSSCSVLETGQKCYGAANSSYSVGSGIENKREKKKEKENGEADCEYYATTIARGAANRIAINMYLLYACFIRVHVFGGKGINSARDVGCQDYKPTTPLKRAFLFFFSFFLPFAPAVSLDDSKLLNVHLLFPRLCLFPTGLMALNSRQRCNSLSLPRSPLSI